ncbi:ethanolamine kinase [Apiospora saccharicola]|uniref:ethanolamine kinase n=1 Tax=Apiospora saccharicola TaxID=335842 RepID=A0ABR1WL56_9PEZI
MPPSTVNGSGSNGASVHIPVIDLSYDPKDADASALRLVTALRPDWAEPSAKVEFKRFTDGITNTLLKAVNKREGASKEDIDIEAILLRAYGHGTDVLIDRQRETQNHELLMQHGLAPELLARFSNGMMYRYLRGTVTTPKDLREPRVYLAVARRLAQWHATMPCVHSASATSNGETGSKNGTSSGMVAPNKPPPNVWTVMQKWLHALPHETEAEQTRQKSLQEELHWLIKELSQRPGLGEYGLVFAHCDLLSGNVIIEPKAAGSPDMEDSVAFIDYEYATPSPAAFDLANHFAEWGGFDCDFTVLPTRSQRREFIAEYIRAYFAQLPSGPADVDVDSEIDKMCQEVDAFRGLPGFYWGIWALIQATISQIDFDYASYAEIRLGEYWAWKAEHTGQRKAKGEDLPVRERRWAEEDKV